MKTSSVCFFLLRSIARACRGLSDRRRLRAVAGAVRAFSLWGVERQFFGGRVVGGGVGAVGGGDGVRAGSCGEDKLRVRHIVSY